MNNEEREKYLKAYYDNEADANRQMGFANAVGAILVLVVWICYLTGAFFASPQIKPAINVIFPVSILILLSPLAYTLWFKDFLRKPNYKYFVVFSFIVVVASLNILLPKNSLLAWALAVTITNHYYNPKLGAAAYGTSLVLMLICLYLSLFVGEYDAFMVGAREIVDGEVVTVFGIFERYELLHEGLLAGKNYYLKAFLFSYLPRAAILTVLFVICNSLNIRTYKLLVEEIHVNSEQEKTKTELDVAKDIQLATLPTEFITSEDVEIEAELRAAKEVGGDFYDYFILDDDHVAMLIADVSGKGIPAAMFMMKTITCFKNFINTDRSPSEILKKVNRTIYQGNDSNMFVTCFLAIINTKTGEMVFSNAGHNPPIIGQNKNYTYLKCKPGFVLGGLEDAFVFDETIQLNKGDTITLYTDGITEAMNKKRELYGEKRLLSLFNKKEYSCLIELHRDLKEDVRKFTDGAEQSDDMTYITLKFHGDKYTYEEKIFEAKMDNIQTMLDFFSHFSNKHNIKAEFATQCLVVADELLSNIVKYGYKEEGGKIYIRLLYNIDKKEFIITIIDYGVEFDPFQVNNQPLEGDISKREEGGLGILIVKKIATEYAYDRLNDKNVITIKKKFEE